MAEPARVLVADPPWLFGDSLPGKGRGASKHYGCLPLNEICEFALPPLADDALLFMWRVASMQREALAVVEAWGFELKSEIVWKKLTKTGKRHFGMGHYVRAEHEVCLIARRGKGKVRDRSVRSVFEAQTGRHSAKPDEFYGLVEQLAEGPYLEMFARRPRPGWSCWGNELEGGYVAA